MKKSLLPLLLAAGLLNACSDTPEAEPTPVGNVEIIEDPEVRDDVASVDVGMAALDGYETVYTAQRLGTMLEAPEGITVVPEEDYVRLSGAIGNNAGYKTEGANIMIPGHLERKFSGERIRIGIIARLAPGAETSRMAVAYSTNDQGNSGWQWYDLSSDFQLYEMYYDVPEMVAGQRDYLGFGSGRATGEIEVMGVGIGLAE